jgi:tetratricopeptide (TPR) repeat protein
MGASFNDFLKVTALAGLCSLPAQACLNAHDPKVAAELESADAEKVSGAVRQIEAAHKAAPSPEHASDLAVARVMAGKYDEAIELLREAETKAPGKSAKVAANLGTALELKGGADEDALYWIREGVKRDANEHEGSEWLHVRILEAKIKLAADPAWLAQNRVLGLDFGTAEVPEAPAFLPIDAEGKLKGVDELLDDIRYQLDERMKFVKPPDAIVGDLAASAGDLVYAGSDGSPTKHYELALRYGAPRAELLQKRVARFKKDYPNVTDDEDPAAQAVEVAAARANALQEITERRKTRKMMWWIGGGVLTVLLILGAGWLFDRLRPKPERPPVPDIDY